MTPIGDRGLPRGTRRDDRGSASESAAADLAFAAPVPRATPGSGRAATNVERALAIATLLAVPAIAPLCNVHLSGSWSKFLLLVAGGLLCWILFAGVIGPLSSGLARFGDRVHLQAMLGIGVVVQVLVAALTTPVPESDFLNYANLARQLASGLPFEHRSGHAMLPPGLPLFLTPFVWVFGPTLAATTAANVVLYLVGACGVAWIARYLFGPHAAGIATLLFTIWPARVLMAGLAAKENLLIAAIIAGTALCFKALDPSTRRPLAIAVLAGIAFGLAALTQPGVAVVLLVVPVGYRFAIAAIGRRTFIGRIAAVAVGAAIAVAPWMARNCAVFEGQFCGISTNGGSVFYRANNPNASGIFMPGRGTPLEGLPELERNRRGYELGRQWILANPLDAAKLTLRKEIAYLGGDDYGAYWAVLRGAGGTEGDALRDATDTRRTFYRLASGLSLVYWVLLAALCVQAIRRWPLNESRAGRALPPLVYPVLCGAAIFGIFESGDRQHMFAVAPLIIVAAAGVVQRHPIRNRASRDR